jgi:hypothetical protein
MMFSMHSPWLNSDDFIKGKTKLKQSLYRPGETRSVPGD